MGHGPGAGARRGKAARVGFVFGVGVAACGGPANAPPPRHGAPPAARPRPVTASAVQASLVAARELDQQGVRAFTEGHYRLAERYFEEAHRHGGPPSELWNVARCQEKVDDMDGAVTTLERYLDSAALSPGEREEGRRQLSEIQRAWSRVTVLSSPMGAAVFVDDRRGWNLGRTPTTFDVAAGEHSVRIELAGHGARVERITARHGRPVILEVDLSRE